MPNAGTRRLLQFGIFALLLAAHLTSQAQKNVEWKDRLENTRNPYDLQEILRKHKQWVQSGNKSGARAVLLEAHLSHANLTGAILPYANLLRADLSDATLTYARLNGADLRSADLSGAILEGAHLSGADLSGAILEGAQLSYADVDRTLFEPKSLPELRGIAAAENLELLTYDTNPDALVQLRKQF